MSVTSMVGAMVSLELIFLGEILVFFCFVWFRGDRGKRGRK